MSDYYVGVKKEFYFGKIVPKNLSTKVFGQFLTSEISKLLKRFTENLAKYTENVKNNIRNVRYWFTLKIQKEKNIYLF